MMMGLVVSCGIIWGWVKRIDIIINFEGGLFICCIIIMMNCQFEIYFVFAIV